MRPFKFITFAIILTVFLPATSFALFVGPYTGQVLDSQTGETIKGASVLIYWEKSIPSPAGSFSEPIKAKLVYADNKGNYMIPRNLASTGLLGFFEATTIIIYQPGYQAYINRIYGKESDDSFKKKDNILKLERIPSGFDHKKHHDRITDALRGLDNEFHDSMGYSVPFHKIVEQNQILTEMWEFQRRIEWEE